MLPLVVKAKIFVIYGLGFARAMFSFEIHKLVSGTIVHRRNHGVHWQVHSRARNNFGLNLEG